MSKEKTSPADRVDFSFDSEVMAFYGGLMLESESQGEAGMAKDAPEQEGVYPEDFVLEDYLEHYTE